MGDQEQNDRAICRRCVYWIGGKRAGYCFLDLHPRTCGHYTPREDQPRDEPTGEDDT